MKGVIQADHIAVNNFQLLVLGIPPLVITELSGIEDELETADLPDRTRASGGNRKATEFTFMLPMHHVVQQAAMEAWFREAQDPVTPTYRKAGTLIHTSISGSTLRTFTLTGLFPTKRGLPDLELVNEGEMAAVEWSMSVNDINPI
ncbi:MAG: phage tail protein [Planctomycetes bacterium]|nr:phage tail protein [Planctomycetota bacterium]